MYNPNIITRGIEDFSTLGEVAIPFAGYGSFFSIADALESIAISTDSVDIARNVVCDTLEASSDDFFS